MNDVSVIFDALSDDTRRRILALLMETGERCVCEIFEELGESQPKVSRHLAVLRDAGLLSARREGQWIHYGIEPELPTWVAQVLEGLRAATRSARPKRAGACRARACRS